MSGRGNRRPATPENIAEEMLILQVLAQPGAAAIRQVVNSVEAWLVNGTRQGRLVNVLIRKGYLESRAVGRSLEQIATITDAGKKALTGYENRL